MPLVVRCGRSREGVVLFCLIIRDIRYTWFLNENSFAKDWAILAMTMLQSHSNSYVASSFECGLFVTHSGECVTGGANVLREAMKSGEEA